MHGHPNKLQTYRSRNNQLNRIITLKPKRIRRSKENNSKWYKTQNNLHSFKYLLS